MNPKTQIVRDTVRRFFHLPSLTIAKYILSTHGPLFDNDLEKIRNHVRRIVGKHGKRTRRNATDKSLYRDTITAIPKTWREIRTPYHLPVGLGLVLSDVHVPFHEPDAVEAAVQAGQAEKVDWVFLNGDIQDCAAVSFWPQRKRDMNSEIEMCIDFFDWLRNQFPDKPIIYKPGNHEYRLPRYYMSKAPELAATPYAAMETVLGFEERDITFLDYFQLVYAGRLPIIHGHEVNGISNAVNAARGLFLKTKSFAACSHCHSTSENPEKTIEGKLLTTWSFGCLCYSPDTEVLTSSGWVPFPKLTTEHQVAEYFPHLKTIAHFKPKAIQKMLYNGDIIRFKSDRIDLLVTPDHKVIYSRSDSKQKIKSAEYVSKITHPQIPISGKYVSVSGNLTWSKLTAWVVTEGSVEKVGNSYRITIYQKNKDKLESIISLLGEIGIKYSRSIDSRNDVTALRIHAKDSLKTMRFMDFQSKRLPREVLNSNYPTLIEVYEILIETDGHRRRWGTDYFATIYQGLADDFQELCSKIGYSCRLKHEKVNTNYKNNAEIIRCCVRKANTTTVKDITSRKYYGDVYDLTTSGGGGFIVVRRNELVAISGNCDLNPDYCAFGNRWNHGFALINIEKDGFFEVVNRRILQSGKVV